MNLKQIACKVFGFLSILFLFVNANGSSVCFTSNAKTKSALLDSIIAFERDRVILLADDFLHKKPVTVTSDFCPRSAGGIHDYYSEGTYWWPNPANPDGPYIQKDGQNNPENFDKHGKALSDFSWIVGTETSAWLLTGKKKYVRAALMHINAWFVDSSSRMNPHLLYAQAIKGVCTGRGIGIIDAAPLIDVAQSLVVLEKAGMVPEKDLRIIKAWFAEYLKWLTTHKYGVDEMNWKNNHATWWHCQAAAYARFVGNEEVLIDCRKRYLEVLLPNQMATNGSFPLELARTKPFGYSLFNLDGFAILTWLLTDTNFDAWNAVLSDGRGMRKGTEFIMPYITDKTSWPYPKDVLHWEEQPNRQVFMLFASIAENQPEWFSLWKKQNTLFPSDESRRNIPLKSPLIWIGLTGPKKQ
jgi:hypothetical protein